MLLLGADAGYSRYHVLILDSGLSLRKTDKTDASPSMRFTGLSLYIQFTVCRLYRSTPVYDDSEYIRSSSEPNLIEHQRMDMDSNSLPRQRINISSSCVRIRAHGRVRRRNTALLAHATRTFRRSSVCGNKSSSQRWRGLAVRVSPRLEREAELLERFEFNPHACP